MIVELFGLEENFTSQLVQPFAIRRHICSSITLLRISSYSTWNVLRVGAAATFLGNLGQRFTNLTVKEMFSISLV